MHPQPPGPGWWLASDGRWYPPGPNQPPPAVKSSNKGCIIAAVVVVVVLLVGAGAAVFFVIWAAGRVGDIAKGGVIGSGEQVCPAASDVAAAVGSPVNTGPGGTIFGGTGCTYFSPTRDAGADVQIVVGPDLIADSVIDDFTSAAKAIDAPTESIPVGQRGQAYTTDSKSAAIAVDGGHVALVEISSVSTSLGDKRDAAVSLLRKVLG